MFFSFPHISIDAAGNVGAISRPGRPGASCACGALNQALVDLKQNGLAESCESLGGALRMRPNSCGTRLDPFVPSEHAVPIHLVHNTCMQSFKLTG